MGIDRLGHPLRTTAWSCRADDMPSRVAFDLVSDQPNRWNDEGEPTIYLSGEPALALVEAGRHPDDLDGTASLITVDVDLPSAVDLRDLDVRASLDLPAEPHWVLDRDRTRQVAQSLRQSGMCVGLIVPSAGAIDQPHRWNVVVFADDRAVVERSLGRPRPAGRISVDHGSR